MQADPDRCLVLACQTGEPGLWCDPFRELHERHRDSVRQICLRITGNGQDALDAAQDTFLLAFRGLRSFRHKTHFARWLRRIASRASLEYWRRHPALRDAQELEEERVHAPREDPLRKVEWKEQRRRIRSAIRALPRHFRDVLLLRHFEGLSYAEIEQRLGIPPGSVRSRLHRAHLALSWSLRALAEE